MNFNITSLITRCNQIKDGAANAMKLTSFKLNESKPTILLVVGIASVVTAAVVACIKTKDAAIIMEDAKKELEEDSDENGHSQEDALNDKGVEEELKTKFSVYCKAGLRIFKVYSIPITLMIFGIGSIIISHSDLKRRNHSLLTSLIATQQLFLEYRKRVKEAIGEEEETRLFMGAETGNFAVINNGVETYLEKGKDNVFVKQPGSMYARNFTPDTSVEYDCRSYADYFLECKIKHLNDKLKTVPFITLNEVYDELGFKNGYGKCMEGMTVGWVYNPKIPRGDREIIVERLIGWEVVEDCEVRECLRLDFNCYPLEGLL